MFTFFDPNSECFAKYDAFCSHIFDVRAEGVRLILLSKRFEEAYIAIEESKKGAIAHSPPKHAFANRLRYELSLAFF